MKLNILLFIFISILLAEDSVIINEINYHSSDEFDVEDWVELYNTTDEIINLENWEFKDEMDDHIFIIPSGIFIFPNDYLVLCKNSVLFISFFPNVTNFIGEFGFGLSGGGEPIRLFNSDGEIVDFVDYDDENLWPISPDGTGPTLELLYPSFDNSLAESWGASVNYGTPGSINSIYLSNNQENSIPNDFIIYPNFPNPFNPITQINYLLHNSGMVKISVFDINGKELDVLTNGFQSMGNYNFIWNAENFPSGVYFIHLNLNGNSQIQKMVLMK